MNIRTLVATSAILAGLIASPAAYAAPSSLSPAVHAMFNKPKTIQISLRNASSSTLELKVGEDVVKIEAGKQVSVRIPIGTKIVTNTATVNHQAGDLLSQATSDLNGATIIIK